MEIPHVILTVASCVAYLFLTFFTCHAYLRMKRQESEQNEMKIMLMKILAITMGEHLKSSFESVNDMKEALEELIEAERFEEAEKLKSVIADAERGAFMELERFRKHFGDECVDVKLMNVRRE